MAIIMCKRCGGDLNIMEETNTAKCEFCGVVQTIPNMDDEKKLIQFERAERLRKQCEFDKAASIYESIVSEFRQESEAYWGLVLCKYGIEYVDDPATGRKIPTCHRSSYESVMDDSDFEQALENADPEACRVYREEAKQIEEIRKGIVAVSAKEAPYDVFICYKETDADGNSGKVLKYVPTAAFFGGFENHLLLDMYISGKTTAIYTEKPYTDKVCGEEMQEMCGCAIYPIPFEIRMDEAYLYLIQEYHEKERRKPIQF